MHATKVGVREFRENLAGYLESKMPLAITRHGETLGVFVPIGMRQQPAGLPRFTKPSKADIEAVCRAGADIDAMIVAMETTAEELIADFEKARRKKRASSKRS